MTTADIQNLIVTTANNLGVPPAIALGVANQESGFNPNVTGAAGEYGLFQLMPATWAQWGGSGNPYDPTANAEAGIAYLADLNTQFDGDWGNALAAYNAGPGAVQSGNVPASTVNYVNQVLAYAGQAGGLVTNSSVSVASLLPSSLTGSGIAGYIAVGVIGLLGISLLLDVLDI
jgi:soluble lytic murein transglycosylase-like protein